MNTATANATIVVTVSRPYPSAAPVYAVGTPDPNRTATIRAEAAELQHLLIHGDPESEAPATRRSLIDLLADHQATRRHGSAPTVWHSPEAAAREGTRRAWFGIYHAMSDAELLGAAASA